MIVLGVLTIIASLAWGFLCVAAAGMSDNPRDFSWSDLWGTYIGLAVGALFIASKWLP